jgi:N6-adenosine-specific RNA methylase IME4
MDNITCKTISIFNLVIDPEFEELITPPTSEEYNGLEESILENGYDKNKPITTWNNTIVDGHNRYAICRKHNIEFTTCEQEFPSRSAAKIWMINEQTKRRNINEMTRAYLVGTRYKEEKKDNGGDRNSFDKLSRNIDESVMHSAQLNPTVQKIAEQSKVNPSTVQRAEKFTNAVDTVVATTGIKRSSILSGLLKSTMRDIVTLASFSPEIQYRVIAKVQEGEETDIKNGTLKVQREERDKAIKEEQERKKRDVEELKKKQEEERKKKEEELKKEREAREIELKKQHDEERTRKRKELQKQQANDMAKKEEELTKSKANEEEQRKQEEELKKKQEEELYNQQKELKKKQEEELYNQQEELKKKQEKELKNQREEQEKEEEKIRIFELNNMRYNVILCDPPWKYDFAETKNREIENNYPTMSLDDLKVMEIPADDNCVLFMWATAPKLKDAIGVLETWGFEYKTCAVWDKEIIGMGYWVRNQHEILLIGTKGNPGAPMPENRYSSVIRARREGHSKKPEIVYDMVEKMCPYGNYLEMFARNKREKWAAWGNQV